MRNFLNKHKFVRVISFNDDKSSNIRYFKRGQLPKEILVNPNHVFMANGYTSVVVKNGRGETINPLDFEAKYDSKMFESAINSKVINDTLNGLKTAKFDLSQIIMFGLILINVVMLYFILKMNGVF